MNETLIKTGNEEEFQREMQRMRALFSAAVDAICEAGEVVAKWARQGWSIEEMSKAANIPLPTMERLLEVGQEKLDPRAALKRRVRELAQLPLAVQAEVLDRGVEMVELGEDPELREVRRLPDVYALTQAQLRQVFAFGKVRSVPEQVAWLLEQREMAVRERLVSARPSGAESVDVVPAARGREGYALVNGVRLGVQDLKRILSRIERRRVEGAEG